DKRNGREVPGRPRPLPALCGELTVRLRRHTATYFDKTANVSRNSTSKDAAFPFLETVARARSPRPAGSPDSSERKGHPLPRRRPLERPLLRQGFPWAACHATPAPCARPSSGRFQE